MRYPSLKEVNLVVVDGRSTTNDSLQIYLAGCLLAIAHRFDGHILIAASTTARMNEYESLGEDVGLDFFFHSELVANSSEFLDLCTTSQLVIEPTQSPNWEFEFTYLRDLKKRVLVPTSLANTVAPWANLITLEDNALSPTAIMKLILNADVSRIE